MMTQEEYVDIPALRKQGWTLEQIGREVGYHPATVRQWLERGGPPPQRQADPDQLVIDQRWIKRIDQLLEGNKELLGTSIDRLLRAEGFEGSYPTLVRYLRQIRGPRKGLQAEVSVPIETDPGEEFQFDFSDCCDWGRMWDLGPLYCFAAILCFSRRRFWWFTDSLDRSHTLEGLVLFFTDIGGVPAIGRTDRMGCLGRSKGKVFAPFPESLEFAGYHGFALKACRSADAKRKGKIERPFRELKESFLQELVVTGEPTSIDELNRRAADWLERYVHPRPHRVTKVAPASRFEAEKHLFTALPRIRFDTARQEPRQVGQAVPLIEVDGVFYSVAPTLAGQLVQIRMPVGSSVIEIHHRGSLHVTHHQVAAGSQPVWDPAHRAQAEALALGRHRKPGPRPVDDGSNKAVQALDLGEGDYDVATPVLELFDPDHLGCGSDAGAR